MPVASELDQFQNVPRRRLAVVDDEIAVLQRNHRAADAQAFQAQFVNQLARGNRAGFLKMQPALGAAGCESQRFLLKAFMRSSISSRGAGGI